jgi:hypothetical protein
MLVNNYPGTLKHPKAVGIMQRTAELLRLWRPWTRCAGGAFRPSSASPRCRPPRLPATSSAAPRPSSLTTPHPSPTARRRGSAARRTSRSQFSATAPSPTTSRSALRLRDDPASSSKDGGVTATIVARDGAARIVRAQCLIATDGNDTGVHEASGIGRAGDADMGHFVIPISEQLRDRAAVDGGDKRGLQRQGRLRRDQDDRGRTRG